jgi:cardiolipin synthase
MFPHYSGMFAGGCLILFSACASTKQLKALPAHSSRLAGPEFRQVMGNVLGAPFTPGNRITSLVDGSEIFPAMLRGIRAAKRTITFETYVFEKGELPKQFAQALTERAKAGVKVSVILDAHGARKARAYHEEFREAGVDFVQYNPIWKNPTRYNNRTHRKILVIDGKVGFVGGVGIADEWLGHAQSPDHWHDTHYRLQGPVVAQLQAAFMDNWLKLKGTLPHGLDYFPPLPPAGSALASLFYASPEHGSRNMEIMFNLALSCAQKSVLIENSYFVPDREAVESLVRAAERGVRIQIILPGEHIDEPAVRRASQTSWGRLLDAGVEISEYQPTMLHTKLMIVDGLFTSVGSSNLDYRSLRINAEANLNVLDRQFAERQTRMFDADLKKSRRINRDEQRARVLKALPLQILQSPIRLLL